MSYIAYFIGGPEDLTKRIVTNRRPRVKFYKRKAINGTTTIENSEDTVELITVFYELIYVTNHGDTLIYEYVEEQ